MHSQNMLGDLPRVRRIFFAFVKHMSSVHRKIFFALKFKYFL